MGLFDRFKNQESKGQEFYCIVGLGNPGRHMKKRSTMLVSKSLTDWQRNMISKWKN